VKEGVVALDVQSDRRPLAQHRDPAETEKDLVALDGYLGTGTDGRWRLYRDLSLSYWLEINEADISEMERVPVDGAPLPVTVLRVQSGALLTAHTSPPDPDLSDFLRNPFRSEDLVAVESDSWGEGIHISKLHVRTKCR
jgi:hypothetical protein